MNVEQMRSFVRTQMDVDEEEYPNALLDSYFEEGFQRTIALEKDWPFYEASWTLVRADGATTIAVPNDLDSIASMIDEGGRRLIEIPVELAEDNFYYSGANLSGYPAYFTVYGGVITLWPATSAEETTYRVRGIRKPATFESTSSFVPDCDERLHRLICHYAIALMYANQEDEVLEEVYMKRWQQGFAAIHHAITGPLPHRPLVLNGGLGAIHRHYPLPPIWDLP